MLNRFVKEFVNLKSNLALLSNESRNLLKGVSFHCENDYFWPPNSAARKFEQKRDKFLKNQKTYIKAILNIACHSFHLSALNKGKKFKHGKQMF